MEKIDESREHHQQAYGDEQPHQAEWTHELAAGGAAFAGFELFERQQRAEGECETRTNSV